MNEQLVPVTLGADEFRALLNEELTRLFADRISGTLMFRRGRWRKIVLRRKIR